MSIPTEFFRWWSVDERTGKRRLTSYAMTRADAAERFQDAEPDLGTREIRDFPEPGERRGNTRPPSSNERSPGPFSSGGRYCYFDIRLTEPCRTLFGFVWIIQSSSPFGEATLLEEGPVGWNISVPVQLPLSV